MHVYPVTFYGTDGTTAYTAGMVVVDMSLQNEYWTLVPTFNGTEYSGYPGGTGLPAPSFTNGIPNFVNVSAALTVNLVSTYLSPYPGCTMSLNGTLPTGWTFGNGTAFAYSGTGSGAPVTVSVTGTLTSNGLTTISNNFQVQGVSAGTATTPPDTIPPTVPLGLTVGGISQNSFLLSGLPSSDPSPPATTWSGMEQYNVSVTYGTGTATNVSGSPFAVVVNATSTLVSIPNYTDLYGITFVSGVSGTASGQTGASPSNVAAGALYMIAENKNPGASNGFYLPNTWNAGAYTGFTPVNAGGHAQLAISPTGTSPCTTFQWEGTSVGVYMLGSDAAASKNRPQFTPQMNFVAGGTGGGPVLFTGTSVTLNNTMTMQCMTYTGTGTSQTNANSPYIHVNLGLIGPGNAYEFDINVCVLDGAGAAADVHSSFVSQSPLNAYLFLCPVAAASAAPYITFTSGAWQNGTFSPTTFTWSISYSQMQNILQYMAAQNWGANPAFPSGLNPTQFTLNQSHVNAEMPNNTAIALGWSMTNWTMTAATGGAGNQPNLQFTTVGSGTSTITQNAGPDITFTTTAVDAPYPTASSLAAAYQQFSGTSWVASCKVASFTASNPFDNVGLHARTNLTAGSPFVSVITCPFSGGIGVLSQYRSTTNGTQATIQSVAGTASPIWLFLQRNGDTYYFSYSRDGNTLVSLGNQTQVMGNPLYIAAGANTADGTSMTATVQQLNIQNSGNWQFTGTALSTATPYLVSVTAQDVAGNVSAASTPITITTTGGTGTGTGTSSTLPNMPITSFYAINGPQATNFSSVSWQNWSGRFNYVNCMNYVQIEGGMNGGHGSTMSQCMGYVKAAAASLGNPYCKTGFYQILNSTAANNRPALTSLLNANNWFVTSGGSQVQYAGGAIPNNCCNTNGNALSPLATSGWASGLDVCQALADYTWHVFLNGTPGSVGETGPEAANPNADFIMLDNQFWDIWASGQWLYNSTAYYSNLYGETTPTAVAAYLQAGYARIVSRLRSRSPSILVQGNCTAVSSAYSVIDAPMQGLYDIAFFENCLAGGNSSAMQYCSANNFIQRMAKLEALKSSSAAAVCIFSQGEQGPAPGLSSWPGSQTPANWAASFTSASMPTNAGGSATWTATYWQAVRYGLCFALLRNWAFDLTAITQAPYWTTPPWMDEYNKGASGVWNWLGTRSSPLVSGVTATDIANGTNLNIGGKSVYLVKFANGYVFLNCIGNGAVTIAAGNIPGGTCQYLSNGGYSDPSTPYGTRVTSFVLKDGDARVMLP